MENDSNSQEVNCSIFGNGASYPSLCARRDNSDDELSRKLDSLRSHLTHLIDANNGLLDKLREKKILTREQFDVLQRKSSSPSEQVYELLSHVFSTSFDGQEQFLLCLEESGQKHVSSYIREDGHCEQAKAREDWPLLHSPEYERIERNWGKLTDSIDTDNGLLDELLSVRGINRSQEERIRKEKLQSEKNYDLLYIIERVSIANYRKLVECLHKTKQHLAAALLTSDEPNSTYCPIADEYNRRLDSHHAFLVGNIDSTNGLVIALFWSQKEFIESASLDAERNRRLLDIVRRGCASDFDKFIMCLEATGQAHISTILLEDGDVIRLVAETGELEHTEKGIVDAFMTLFKNSPTDRRKELLNVLTTAHEDVTLLAMCTHHSIQLVFFICKTSVGFLYLLDLFSSDRLKGIISDLFTHLLDNDSIVAVETLRWEVPDYQCCMETYCRTMNCRTLSHIYRLAHRSLSSYDNSVCSIIIESLPLYLWK